jgi:molecular chaperone HtpG
VLARWDPTTRYLSIEDAGTGMDRDTIEHHLMRVGSSYYNTPQFEADNKDFTPISRFGIGILTCFMVSDDIEIITVKAQKGHRIRMTSVKSTYLLRELDPGDPLMGGIEPHGTLVTLRLRDTVDLDKGNVEGILQHWIILPECPVNYIEIGRPLKSSGHQSISEAQLAGFHSRRAVSKQYEGQQTTQDRKVEVVVKAKEMSSSPLAEGPLRGRFELAFAVNQGYFPEREFVP